MNIKAKTQFEKEENAIDIELTFQKNTSLSFILKKSKMKKSTIEKTKYICLVDVRDYISNSMILNSTESNSTEKNKDKILNKTVGETEEKKPFNLFAHIIEG